MTAFSSAHLELNFCPNVELVTIARRFVSDIYGRMLGDPDATSRIALATHELLENAVKYSIDGSTTIRIDIASSEATCTISVRTRNRATAENTAILCEIIDEIARSGDASAFYQVLLRKNAKQPEGSGLGLARICAEGEMTMRYELAGEDVSIIAQAELPRVV